MFSSVHAYEHMFIALVMCLSVLVYSLSEVFFIEPKYMFLLRAWRSVELF